MTHKKKIANDIIGLAMKSGMKTTEFGTAGLLITYLMAQGTVTGNENYAFAAAGVAGAYILGRSILKAVEILKQ